jgi:hypothetical protein
MAETSPEAPSQQSSESITESLNMELEWNLRAVVDGETESYLHLQNLSLWGPSEKESLIEELDALLDGKSKKKASEIKYLPKRLRSQLEILFSIRRANITKIPDPRFLGLKRVVLDVENQLLKERFDNNGKEEEVKVERDVSKECVLKLKGLVAEGIDGYWFDLQNKIRWGRNEAFENNALLPLGSKSRDQEGAKLFGPEEQEDEESRLDPMESKLFAMIVGELREKSSDTEDEDGGDETRKNPAHDSGYGTQ